MTNKELLKRIEELEERTKQLEMRPIYVYPPVQPVIVPQPTYPGFNPPWTMPIVWCDTATSTS